MTNTLKNIENKCFIGILKKYMMKHLGGTQKIYRSYKINVKTV